MKREVGEVAIVAVLAGRGIGDEGIHTTVTTNLYIFVILVIWTQVFRKICLFVHCFKNSIHRRGQYMYQEK
jgi:hypothetical protein